MTPRFVTSGIELAPLSMPLARAREPFVFAARNPQGEWTCQHLMAVNGNFSGITRNDLLGVADRFGIGTYRRV